MKTPGPSEAAALAWPSMAAGLLDGMLDAVWLVDATSLQIVGANAAAGTLMGVAASSLHGRCVTELCATPEDHAFWIDVAAGRCDGIDSSSWVRRSDASMAAVTRRVSRVDAAPGHSLYMVVLRDRSEQLEAIRRIEAMSLTDALTGLPNRRVLADRTDFSMALAQRDGTPFALLFVDVDHFRHINDTLGHAFGDRVLIDVAERLKACLRQVDTVARLAGDQFVLLVHHADAPGAETAARRVQDALQRPFTHGGLSFTVTCSVGIALYPGDGVDFDELLRRADAAMHVVKEAGRAGYQFHRPGAGEAEVNRRSRLKLDHAMRQALANRQFRLHYQPQVDMQTGQVRGAEALLRWTDPELGDVSPGEFIPVAEESGFIVAIGEWVLRQAVQQAAQWHADGRQLIVSVNVSAVQFQRAGFVDSVAAALNESGLDPQLLELELTESILIQNAQETLQRLQALAQLGVKLSIDDFGTGYSSLGYLKRFPIHRLKIDRSFVKGLPGDSSDAGIVNAIINLGRALHLEIVAEGVETEAQREFLQNTGCEQYQGFLFAPALARASFEALLPQPLD